MKHRKKENHKAFFFFCLNNLNLILQIKGRVTAQWSSQAQQELLLQHCLDVQVEGTGGTCIHEQVVNKK